jgi:hypothetical protein
MGLLNFNILKHHILLTRMFIGDWGLGIGDWGLGPIPNPQSPIPNPHFFSLNFKYFIIKSFSIKINSLFHLFIVI